MNIKNILIFFVVVMVSCKKVITITVKDTDKKYVIEGVVTNEPGSCKVYISRTKNYNEDNQFDGVSGATVSIKDNGIVYPLTEVQPGTYTSVQLTGTPGHLYDLGVQINGDLFTSSCRMPMPVVMDTLYIARGPFGQFKFATIAFTDPAGIDNGYRFIQYINGVKEPTIFTKDDTFTDGQSTLFQLDASGDTKDDPRNIKTGDEVVVEMLTLDNAVYKYWFGLRAAGGDGSSNVAAPSNPPSNISGGAIGYFSAHTIDKRKVIAP